VSPKDRGVTYRLHDDVEEYLKEKRFQINFLNGRGAGAVPIRVCPFLIEPNRRLGIDSDGAGERSKMSELDGRGVSPR
jgi:hypothetical protein